MDKLLSGATPPTNNTMLICHVHKVQEDGPDGPYLILMKGAGEVVAGIMFDVWAMDGRKIGEQELIKNMYVIIQRK